MAKSVLKSAYPEIRAADHIKVEFSLNSTSIAAAIEFARLVDEDEEKSAAAERLGYDESSIVWTGNILGWKPIDAFAIMPAEKSSVVDWTITTMNLVDGSRLIIDGDRETVALQFLGGYKEVEVEGFINKYPDTDKGIFGSICPAGPTRMRPTSYIKQNKAFIAWYNTMCVHVGNGFATPADLAYNGFDDTNIPWDRYPTLDAAYRAQLQNKYNRLYNNAEIIAKDLLCRGKPAEYVPSATELSKKVADGVIKPLTVIAQRSKKLREEAEAS